MKKYIKYILIILLISFIYVPSVIYQRYWLSAWFGKGGKVEGVYPGLGVLVFTYMPICNTSAAIVDLFDSPYMDGHGATVDSKKLIGIK